MFMFSPTSTPKQSEWNSSVVPLTKFGSKSSDNSSLIQSAIDSGENIYIPAASTNDVWQIDSPIVYDSQLLLCGNIGYHATGNFISQIRGTANLGSTPMFHRRGAHLKYQDTNNAPHVWDGNPAAITTTAIVSIRQLSFRSLSNSNSCLQLFNTTQSEIANSNFSGIFRGIESIRSTGLRLRLVNATGPSGTQVGQAWIDNVQKTKNSCLIFVTGNTTLEECNVQGGIGGVSMIGHGTQLTGGRFEALYNALILGGRDPDPANLNNILLARYCELGGFTTESCRYGLEAYVGEATEIRNSAITGTAAPQTIVTQPRGHLQNGLSIPQRDAFSEIRNVSVSGSYREGGLLIGGVPGSLPNVSVSNTYVSG